MVCTVARVLLGPYQMPSFHRARWNTASMNVWRTFHLTNPSSTHFMRDRGVCQRLLSHPSSIFKFMYSPTLFIIDHNSGACTCVILQIHTSKLDYDSSNNLYSYSYTRTSLSLPTIYQNSPKTPAQYPDSTRLRLRPWRRSPGPHSHLLPPPPHHRPPGPCEPVGQQRRRPRHR
jgi:hypothetical protein